MFAVNSRTASPTKLQSLLDAISILTGTISNEIQHVSIPEGTYIGNNIEIKNQYLEVSGERSHKRTAPGTHILTQSWSERCTNEEKATVQTHENCLFSLTNSTMSLKSIHFTLIDNSTETKNQKNKAETPRLAIVSNSMLTIFESRIELSPLTSAIVISPTTFEESATEASVVVNKCWIANDIGEMRGFVETSAFPSFGGSVSMSIVGCSFPSHRILGTDGIGLSLTRTPRQNVDEVGIISSSLVGCSFVNMSSIGSSCPPQLSHLSQKMLGCVVSLTCSHLSGSTIRDVNNGGSVLCSNSSFSSLLSSPNTDQLPTITLPNGTTTDFEPQKTYSFTDANGTASTSATFSHCHFHGLDYASGARPLSFSKYPGSISVLSCSFTNLYTMGENGGGLLIEHGIDSDVSPVQIVSTRFQSCWTSRRGGGLVVSNTEFSSCQSYVCGGAMVATVSASFAVSFCCFRDCLTKAIPNVAKPIPAGCFCFRGQGIGDLTIQQCEFDGCVSESFGGAMSIEHPNKVDITDSLVQNCRSDTSGAFFLDIQTAPQSIALTSVCFIDNQIGASLPEDPTQFADIAMYSLVQPDFQQFSIVDCFTTAQTDSVGLHLLVEDETTQTITFVRQENAVFCSMGPQLKGEVKPSLNHSTMRIELAVEGTVPVESQEYEVTLKEDGGEETRGTLLFANAIGSLVAPSTPTLKFSTSYTITSIEGVVDSSSSSVNSNAITVPDTKWTFHLSRTPSFLSFTTPAHPAQLNDATAHILNNDQQYAFILLVFDREVSGSYDFVVEEEGKDVTFTVVVAAPETTTETEGFVVVGDDRILTHDTTYQIKSLSPTPGTESTTTPVGMSDPISFHIRKSSFVPPIARGVVVVARGGSDSMDECGGDDLPCRTVWTGQMCGKGKGGEWMWVLVRGEAEMGDGFEIEGSVGMTLSSESPTRRCRVVIGNSSFSSSGGIVSISSARVEVKDLNVILPSSEERSSSGWVFVVDSEGTLEADSIGLSGEGQIGVGLAKVKSGTGRFDSVSMSSGSFGGVGVIVGEGMWN
ncbi:hypothetical protein BLNAU_17549 [Blattamonas nauphoetae]|uniref:Right handed beta helix domain-containing protein n=1 Tax=Blattamonas nauphoetae TaxID=2049346 RepID=A0ABQ9X9H3_9EUKA|nr:hypothetical protein BLNAU_17549 [Blattamonas nauphoetae]